MSLMKEMILMTHEEFINTLEAIKIENNKQIESLDKMVKELEELLSKLDKKES